MTPLYGAYQAASSLHVDMHIVGDGFYSFVSADNGVSKNLAAAAAAEKIKP